MVLSVRTFSLISAQVAADCRAEPHWRCRRLQEGKLGHDRNDCNWQLPHVFKIMTRPSRPKLCIFTNILPSKAIWNEHIRGWWRRCHLDFFHNKSCERLLEFYQSLWMSHSNNFNQICTYHKWSERTFTCSKVVQYCVLHRNWTEYKTVKYICTI